MINDTQKDILGDYIAEVAGEMGLTDWYFSIKIEDRDDPNSDLQTLASVKTTPGRRSAKITVGPDFLEHKSRNIRLYICHELVHCHLAAVQDQVEEDLIQHLGKTADELFSHSFRRNLEYAVDGISTFWAPELSMPPDFNPKKGKK